MKIKKENIKKIISILEEKYNELEDNEYFEFNGVSLIKKDISIYNHYLINLAKDGEEQDLINNYVNNRLDTSEDQEDSDAWTGNDSTYYYAEIENNIYKNGWSKANVKEQMRIRQLPIIDIKELIKQTI